MRIITVVGLLALLGAGCKTATQDQSPVATSVPTRAPDVVTVAEASPTAPESRATQAVMAATDLVVDQALSPLEQLRAIYFEFDSAELTDDSRALLEEVAEWLVTHPSVAIRIEGHTDARGTSEYNLALGERRAVAIATYLSHLGVNEAQLTTVSYGEEVPATLGDDETAYAQNRRGEVVPEAEAVVGALE